MKNRNVLILVPAKTASGGISNYYQVLRQHLPDNIYYLVRGARNWPYHSSFVRETLRVIKDYIKFCLIIVKHRIQIIQTTTSLGKSAILRDAIFIIISKFLRVKVIVFFRGWNPKFEYIFLNSSILRSIYFSTQSIICLSRHTKNFLLNSGYKGPLFIDTTVVDNSIFNNINEDYIINKFTRFNEINILFLARIEQEKGIYEALETFKELKKLYPETKLYIAGDGRSFNDIQAKIRNEKLRDIYLTGHLTGTEKFNLFKRCHIYFLPSYTEGMPNSVLEAMGFGLPIIANSVGGLKDILENSVNGYLSDSVDVKLFVQLFINLINDKDKMCRIGITNYHYAKNNFSSEIVANRLLKIFEELEK